MRKAVETAMRIQSDRYAGTGIRFNGELSGRLLRDVCRLKPEAERLMAASFAALGLSARAHDRILKIARTIADLEQSESIEAPHLAEALQYRSFERRIEA
jgi:magnesium chelatase family protein